VNLPSPPIDFQSVLITVALTLALGCSFVVLLAVRQKRNLQVAGEALERLGKVVRNKELENVKLATQLEQRSVQLKDQQVSLQQFRGIKESYIEVQARLREKNEQLHARELLLKDTRNSLLKEFELAAARLLESKQESFTRDSQRNIEAVLSPFKQQLQSFHQHVDDLYSKENAQRHQLIGQIGELQKHARRISEDANNLASALKGDNKVQGQWGEMILERLLEQSGLVKGREYDTQNTYKGDEGKQYRPDAIVHLPEQKDIIVDSKVALVEYERYSLAHDAEQRTLHLKAHVEAIRTHVKSLSAKRYEQLQGIRTLNFVFMFIPIEAAYITAIQHSPMIFKEAQDKNILLVSPSSLMVALRTVETMWRYEKQNANAETIASSAGKLYDQFVLVISALEEVGSYIDKAGQSHERVFKRLTEGRGNLLKRMEDLKKLGAKSSRSLPTMTKARADAYEKEIEFGDDNE